MNKRMLMALMIGFLFLLMTVVTVSADRESVSGVCNWIRPGYSNITGHRATRVFQGTYGRFSDGSIKCFSPNNNWRLKEPKQVINSNDPICNEVCTEETITRCHDKCEWTKKCKIWFGHHCVKYTYKRVCHEECCEKTINVCEEVCK